MATNPFAKNKNRPSRIESVRKFNIRTLKTLNYYGGYSTTKTLSQIHQYTVAGVRKRMNSMVKSGWIKKIEYDAGLGRAAQIWCITKSGRIASQTEHDEYSEPSKLKSFSVHDYSPALHFHTSMVQVLANFVDQKVNDQEIKPLKFDVTERGKLRYIYPDILFDAGTHTHKDIDKTYSLYDFYEVELTVKSIKRYIDLFIRIALHNQIANYKEFGYQIQCVIYITTPQLSKRLNNILEKTASSVPVYLFDYRQIMSENTFSYEDKKINNPSLTDFQLSQRR